MITETTVPIETQTRSVYTDIRHYHSVCWGAIFAGVTTAIGIHLLLTALAAAIGLATFSPLTDQNPAEHFTVAAALAWDLCALVALAVGGWVAGWFSASPKTGCLHGIVVWSFTLIIAVALISTEGGMALGGTLKVLGTGAGLTSAALAGGVADTAKIGVKQNADQISSFINEAVKAGPTNAAPGADIRSRREVGLAVSRLFMPGGDVNSADNKTAVLKALTEYGGVSKADAEKMVNEWIASYNELKAQMEQAKTIAEQKAREAADKASRPLAEAAGECFFALSIGLLVTVLAGHCGARKMQRHMTRVVINP